MKFSESQCLVEILSDGLKRGIESGLGGEVGDADEIAFGNGKEEKRDEQSGTDGQEDGESFCGESELLMSEPDGKWIQENDEDDTRTLGKEAEYRCGYGESIEACKAEIDERFYE